MAQVPSVKPLLNKPVMTFVWGDFACMGVYCSALQCPGQG